MASSHHNVNQRAWMYNRVDRLTRCPTAEFQEGLADFLRFASQNMLPGNKIWCPCKYCQNKVLIDVKRVGSHLYNKGFKPNYTVWTAHGESLEHPPIYQRDDQIHEANNIVQDNSAGWNYFEDFDDGASAGMISNSGRAEAYVRHFDEPVENVPNDEAANFFKALDSAKEPLHQGCVEGLSKFSFASDMMYVKTKNNVSEETFNDFSRVVKHSLPKGNIAAETYYETERTMRTLSMPFVKIDVCLNNCMIYWSESDKDLLECKFCDTPRYKPEKNKSKKGATKRKRIPYKKMFYLPITDRLKRLYLSLKTAGHMRWHAEHTRCDEKMEHPSDAKAWKHFNQVYTGFASNSRNVYLGLCTDGFNPFGMSGSNYSLWPIILTPYNLPPDLCMKKEYLFLSILVPGPNHPKRSLDIFLQPLIEELQGLWSTGVEAYDISCKLAFNLRAVLLWTISDFPAYGMLSGWTTHGKFSCPYCMGDTDAFQLQHGRKTSWFDCHRRFLHESHSYRKIKRSFRKGIMVTKRPPHLFSGEDIVAQQLQTIGGLKKTIECGGNGHINNNIEGYLLNHNWHKHSIFWELPYWKTHLLRHNLDVMHIEKIFFDNIFNTVFNVTGRTTDTINSRRDIALYCDRKSLHLVGRDRAPVPIFRMTSQGKQIFLRWLKHEVKFPDGYVSNIGRCINEDSCKIYGLKSHDCHVLMQRIFPFAFAKLLSPSVHEAIADVGLFFRDLSARSLTMVDVTRLQKNISQTLCNLEKIFPPSFFDVMEHLPVHLPTEAELGGPVQFRWMYPFERFMFDLKKKGGNKAKVEGSIVEAYINEEISTFTSQYYDIPGTIMNIMPKKRHSAGYLQHITYLYDAPEIFCHVGVGSGKSYKAYLSDVDRHIAHTYILLNCQEIGQYERLYDSFMRSTHPGITEYQLSVAKQQGFSNWLLDLVRDDYTQSLYPLWLHELAKGPIRKCKCWNKYFSRGYNFHTVQFGEHQSTTNYGVCVRGNSGDEESYYGKLKQIVQLAYHGAVGLKVTLFRCDWFDTTRGTGTRMRKPGVVEVFATGNYEQYDPFILTTQADQVCFLRYPRITNDEDEWLVVQKVTPRGMFIDSSKQLDAVQEENNDYFLASQVGLLNLSSLVIPGGQVEDIPQDPIIDFEEEGYGSDLVMPECDSTSDSDSSPDSTSSEDESE